MTNLGHVNRAEPQAETIPSDVLEHAKMLSGQLKTTGDRPSMKYMLAEKK